MSLLTNPFFAAGSGLLARSGPSLAPVNPYGGVMEGLLAASKARAFEQDQAMNQMRIKAMQERMGREAAVSEWAQGLDDPVARMFPELYAQESVKAQFQPEAEPSELVTMPDGSTRMVTPQQAAELLQQGASPYETPPVEWGEAEIINSPDGKPILVQRSSAGQVRQIGGGGVNVNVNESKPISASEAGKIRMPDGSPPRPGMTMPEIVAAGGRYVTGAETKVEEMDAKEAAATPRAQSSFGDYSTSAEEWAKDKDNPEKFAAMQQERRRLAQILAQQRNPGRAPTDADIDVAMGDIPVPISVADFLATGDQNPFKAKLSVLGKEIGITPEPPGNPPAGGSNIEGLYNKYGLER